MTTHDVIEAAGAVIMFLLTTITGWSTVIVRGLRADVTKLMIELENKVGYDAFSQKSNFLHEKINEIDRDQGERIAILEDRQGIERKPSRERRRRKGDE